MICVCVCIYVHEICVYACELKRPRASDLKHWSVFYHHKYACVHVGSLGENVSDHTVALFNCSAMKIKFRLVFRIF